VVVNYAGTFPPSLPPSLPTVPAVGASVLWLTYARDASPSEVSGLVAKGSFR
jgi:hypothetical protein